MEEVEFEVGSSSGVETEVVWVRMPLVMKAGVEEREGLRWSYIVDRGVVGVGGWGGRRDGEVVGGREEGRKEERKGGREEEEEEEERFSLPRRLVFLVLCK